MKKKLKIGLLYLGLHNQLIKKYGAGTIITRKEFFEKIGRHYMLPKNLRPLITKEMEKAELIRVVNRDNLEILHTDIDIEKDSNKIYSILKMF